MGRYKLSDEERLKGVRRCLASPKTPKHLKPGLKRYLSTLEHRVMQRNRNDKSKQERSKRDRPKRSTLGDWFRL